MAEEEHFDGTCEEIYAEPAEGDVGTCAVCGLEIVLRGKISFRLTDPPGTPTTKTLEWWRKLRVTNGG